MLNDWEKIMEENKLNNGINQFNHTKNSNETNESSFVKINLTNEQKLEYLSNLIQEVDREFESSELYKKFVKQKRR